MKTIIIIIGMFISLILSAQTDPVNDKTEIYGIHVTTMNDNMLKVYCWR